MKIIVDAEMQRDFYLGYDIVTRRIQKLLHIATAFLLPVSTIF